MLTLDEYGVTYGPGERLSWPDLVMVEIVTTDEGPFAEDVFWLLHGSRTTLRIPQSIAEIAELIVRLQQLPGFDNRAVIAAMTSASNARFPCWERPPA